MSQRDGDDLFLEVARRLAADGISPAAGPGPVGRKGPHRSPRSFDPALRHLLSHGQWAMKDRPLDAAELAALPERMLVYVLPRGAAGKPGLCRVKPAEAPFVRLDHVIPSTSFIHGLAAEVATTHDVRLPYLAHLNAGELASEIRRRQATRLYRDAIPKWMTKNRTVILTDRSRPARETREKGVRPAGLAVVELTALCIVSPLKAGPDFDPARWERFHTRSTPRELVQIDWRYL